MNDLLKRCGTFTMPSQLIEEHPEEAMRLLSGLLIIRAEQLYWNKCIEYTAFCKDFDLVDEGEMPPDYHAVISQTFRRETNDFTYSIDWHRVQ